MLKHIKLENFKSWRELDIDLAPITILFGTNSSGKTTILQSLLLLKQTVNSLDHKQQINFGDGERDFVDFGTWHDLVFGHNLTNHVSVNLNWDEQHVKDVAYHTDWAFIEEQLQIQELSYRMDLGTTVNPYLLATRQDHEKYLFRIAPGWRFDSRDTDILLDDQVTYSNNEALGSIESCYRLPVEIRTLLKQSHETFSMGFSVYNKVFENLIENIEYIGPLRYAPKRFYQSSGLTTGIIGMSGENTIPILSGAQRYQPQRLQQIVTCLIEMGMVDDFRVVTYGNLNNIYEPKVTIGTIESSLIDVGFGVSQILPVITMLYFAPEGSIILLEQPELHLHPNAQSHLADLMLEVAEERKLQLIVESHSEHLLTRLQRRIAEVDQEFANPDNIKMYFCDIKDGESVAQPVEVDEYGQIQNWPPNFFGDRGGDLEAMTEAGIQRRRRELEARG